MNPDVLKNDLKTNLVRALNIYRRSVDGETLLAMKGSMDSVLDKFFKNPTFTEKVDVLDLIITILKDHENDLDRLGDRFENILRELNKTATGFGELVMAKATSQRVCVRTQSRVVVNEFPPGTWLQKKKMLDREGNVRAVYLEIL